MKIVLFKILYKTDNYIFSKIKTDFILAESVDAAKEKFLMKYQNFIPIILEIIEQ